MIIRPLKRSLLIRNGFRLKLNWRNESGVITISFIGIMIVLLILTAFVIDYGRVMYYKHQLQAMADAVSLSGASATYAEVEGNDIEVYIDPQRAEVEAYNVLKINAFHIYNQHLDKSFVGWKGEVISNQKFYHVQMTGNIQFLFPELHGYEKKDVTVESKGKIQVSVNK